MVKQNPCRYCINAVEYKGHKKPGGDMCPCENYKDHLQYLKSKRKYKMGNVIEDINILLRQKMIYVTTWDKSVHIEVIKSLQFRTVLKFLDEKFFYEAESED